MSNGKRFKRLTIGKSSYIYYDTIVIDDYRGTLVFASLVDTAKELKAIQFELNRNNSVYVEDHRSYVTTNNGKYEFENRKQSNSEFAHLVANRKDNIETLGNDNELLTAYIYIKAIEEGPELAQELNAKVFDKLYANTSIPIMEEWMSHLVVSFMRRNFLREITVLSMHDPKPFRAYKLEISKVQLLEIVQAGLRQGNIKIGETQTTSELMECIEGLDSYLNIFGDTLAHKIQESFEPKFDPQKDEYTDWVNFYDDSCYHNGIEIYNAQKATIQAAVNNLEKNNVTFVISEMGTGKTLMGQGIAYAHHKKKTGMTNVVMCPSHLVEKWKREVEKLVPNAKAYIITNIHELINIERKIKGRHKMEHTFIIVSKETAKFSYETRPCAVWSKTKNTFVCPCCGQPLTKKERVGSGRNAAVINKKFDKLDMLTQLAYNTTCMNKVKVFNKKTRKWEEQPCNTSLWAPFNKEDKNTGWIKLGKSGWIMEKHVDELFEEFIARNTLTKKEGELFAKLAEVKNTLDEGEELKGVKAPRKYSIAKYIRERFRGYIDYFICDELHLFKGNTKQGQAMADIASASKYFIGLTGTLLNGYASGLFYILYRTLPQLMKKEGFEYSDEASFMRQYGVVERTSKFAFTNGRQGQKIGTGQEKPLPGVSPLVFTKFLLENAVFLSLSDMDGGLPAYEEIPLSVPMDDSLDDAYSILERELRECCSWQGEGGMKAMGSLLQALSVYPDMPYNQPDVLHPDTNEVLVSPLDLGEGLRNKERRMLELVQEKIAAGEKVLVYYEWTNRTDVAQKLDKMFKDNGINSVIMTSSVSASEREEWIENKLAKGIDVLICNPKLVETGLDLLSFTTIIFYQIGYNIFTMRQASRRSWRLSQDKDIQVYFLYYEGTIQAQALALMATKLQASMAIEGKFSEEGLRAMSNNENLLTQIANSVVEGIKDTIEIKTFATVEKKDREHDVSRTRIPLSQLLIKMPKTYSLSYLSRSTNSKSNRKPKSNKSAMLDLLHGINHVGNLF